MNCQWIKQDNNKDVIVVFGGWAVGFAPLAHLQGDYDILFVDDFRLLDAELPPLAQYDRRILVAFSFGVAAYAHWQAGRMDCFTAKIAINGSVTPVDRKTGIPPVIMQKTIDSLDIDSLQMFLTRCFGDEQPRLEADVNALKDELLAVQQRGNGPLVVFDKAILSDKDRIFMSANLLRAFEGTSTLIKTINGSHIPFAAWTRWEEIVDAV
ncbi:pimeloyl-ACP methyl esterase BioG family protein [Maritalea porphyrae]|uniref:Biotin synthesis protein BioG n=1 Tax=Maritalea porphyrae TaxID=880732 RepID=A0ABQ5UUE7_9HYPH|nr:pimeloyl-ACP methyl esterase BioG family protein [Maritalea porphyrae]GLQ18188.1 hypothetical protein GCM10007879_24370 [Maritalea porphyrae]